MHLPTISATEYQARRHHVLNQIAKDAIVIIAAAKELTRTGDSTHSFRQQSDFYYLTGFNEPDAVLVLARVNQQDHFILFNRQRDPAKELWDGKRSGQEGAIKDFGANEAYPVEMFTEKLPQLLENFSEIYFPIGQCERFDAIIIQAMKSLQRMVRRGVNAPQQLRNIAPIVHEMRLIKSEAELAIMRKVGAISVEAHKQAMRVCKPGLYEYEVEAELTYTFSRHGCAHVAYTPIVGGGSNACILHYVSNRERLNAGDLLLVDAGGELYNYASDITTTFPVSGQFSPEQKALYELVLTAQQSAIAIIRPGLRWDEIQQKIVHILTQGLVELGILKGDVETLIADGAYRRFYMHLSGHWLGLDTHDAGIYKSGDTWRTLQPNMVLTVEPGLYVPANSEGVDPKWWNIGIRIEDDICVTVDGYEVLTPGLPRTVADIEAFMRAA